jgi:hypothetical protein
MARGVFLSALGKVGPTRQIAKEALAPAFEAWADSTPKAPDADYYLHWARVLASNGQHSAAERVAGHARGALERSLADSNKRRS